MHIGWIWPLSTWALSRRSADTYSARPDCRASPSSPFSSLGSNLIEGPKSAIRTENLPERMSISTKCRAAKPLPPVTTHHFCSPSILHKALQTAVYWLTFTFNNWIHSLPFFFLGKFSWLYSKATEDPKQKGPLRNSIFKIFLKKNPQWQQTGSVEKNGTDPGLIQIQHCLDSQEFHQSKMFPMLPNQNDTKPTQLTQRPMLTMNEEI